MTPAEHHQQQCEEQRWHYAAGWNRCDICGRFIAFKEFEDGTATRNFLTPESYLTSEEFETIHLRCDK